MIDDVAAVKLTMDHAGSSPIANHIHITQSAKEHVRMGSPQVEGAIPQSSAKDFSPQMRAPRTVERPSSRWIVSLLAGSIFPTL